MLTPVQVIALREAARADVAEARQYMIDGNANALLDWFNRATTFVVWKSLVLNSEVGRSFVATGVAALTSANNDRLMSFALWNPEGIQPWRTDHRAFFDDVFSLASGATTRAALLALWKRPATNAERALAIGPGTDAQPATLTFEGEVYATEATGIVFKDDGSLWGV